MLDNPIVMSFVRSALVPAVGVTVLFFLLGGIKEPWRTRLQGLVLALGYMVGSYLLLARFNVPPKDVPESFGWGALLLGGVLFVLPRPIGPRYLVRGLIVLALGFLILWPIRDSAFTPQNYRNLIAFACLGLGVWSILERSSASVRTSTLILLPLIAATGLSLLMLFKASASYANLVTVLCAALGGLFVLSFIFPSRVSKLALLPFVSVFVIMMMAAGHFSLDINPWHMIYLCVPFLILWIREWLSFIPENPVIEAIVLGILAAVPVAYFVYGQAVQAGPLY